MKMRLFLGGSATDRSSLKDILQTLSLYALLTMAPASIVSGQALETQQPPNTQQTLCPPKPGLHDADDTAIPIRDIPTDDYKKADQILYDYLSNLSSPLLNDYYNVSDLIDAIIKYIAFLNKQYQATDNIEEKVAITDCKGTAKVLLRILGKKLEILDDRRNIKIYMRILEIMYSNPSSRSEQEFCDALFDMEQYVDVLDREQGKKLLSYLNLANTFNLNDHDKKKINDLADLVKRSFD